MLIVLLRDRNASIYSECVLILFTTVFLSPIPQKSTGGKTPAEFMECWECRAQSLSWLMSIMRRRSIKRLRFLTQVPNSTFCSTFHAKCRTITNTLHQYLEYQMMVSFSLEFSTECKLLALTWVLPLYLWLFPGHLKMSQYTHTKLTFLTCSLMAHFLLPFL